MGAIGLNPIRLDRIGLDPIRINAIRLGVPGVASGSDRPYIDPKVLASLKAVCICYGKSNDDSDRAIVKNLVDTDNPFIISNAAYTEGSGYADKDSPYYGAFVTDGVDDLITSTKTVQEMGITDEVTVVSMIHQISSNSSNICRNNFICNKGLFWRSNNVINTGKTGIYGYTSTNNSTSVINNILGDKNDYSAVGDKNDITPSQFSVVGYIGGSTGEISHTSSVAWYWTVIANKVLTTDQINQVIAYYNLDRCVEPTVLYDVKRQGLSNDTPDSDWYLKDFSKNGFDMSLFNFAKKGNSGVGKYEVDFTKWSKSVNYIEGNSFYFKVKNSGLAMYTTSELSIPSFKVNVIGGKIYYMYVDSSLTFNRIVLEEGINVVPESFIKKENVSVVGFGNPIGNNEITITQIPSHAGALCFDGVEDYGKVTGLPIYKDYTVVADRELFNVIGCVLSNDNPGAFIFETSSASAYSFGEATSSLTIPTDKQIRYQTKYSYNGQNISIGAVKEGTSNMWLGTIRDNDARFRSAAIYSLMTFPYSMSEFLIERQLKKHKLGTLYPDMVEWRPIYTSNVNDYTMTKATYFGETGQHDLALGNHYPIGTRFRIYVKPSGAVDEVTSIKVNGVELTYDYIDSNYGYAFNGTLSSKSPQKIDITIDEYIRYEDIVQPYPSLFTLIDYDTEEVYSWGSKLKVGTKFTGEVINLLPGMYQWDGDVLYNGEILNWGINPGIVAKEMAFSWSKSFKYLFDNNAPKCILSPSRLRIPNSSYKILGYIPDISGHGNHGKINNSAYAEGSGVNADGSYQLDGVDDFITIPTTVGGKQVLMKVNWQSSIGQGVLYDQRGTAFAIWNSDKYNDDETDTIPAYSARNGGNTYIDGILNKNILASQLRNITHNIVATNTMLNGSSVSPTIGCRTEHDAYFTNMSLYDFMLFDEISTDEEILTLNEYIGIEPKSKEGLLQPSITVNGSYVVLNTVEDTNDYLVNGTANCGIGFSDESASEQFSTGVTYDKNFSYSIIVIANNNKELISLSHNGVSADSIQSMDYSETTKLYICSTTNGMFAVGSAPQEIIIELSD